MGARTEIGWTDASWNTVTGCDAVSDGCLKCYAETLAERFRGVEGHYYENGFDLTLREGKLEEPLHWKKPRRVFVNSMSDTFHPGVPETYLDRIWAVMRRASQHQYQVLTKRPGRMRAYLRNREPLPNVWLGVSVENEQNLWRMDILRELDAPVRFVSAEPLLGSLAAINLEGIDWLIAGGESGHGARRMLPEWPRELRDACQRDGVAFFMKQWGEHNEEGVAVGKKAAGRELDGRTWDEFPEVRPVVEQRALL